MCIVRVTSVVPQSYCPPAASGIFRDMATPPLARQLRESELNTVFSHQGKGQSNRSIFSAKLSPRSNQGVIYAAPESTRSRVSASRERAVFASAP